MPRIIVQADSGAVSTEAKTLEEWVQPSLMESDWFSTQLVERLAWAVQDAARAEAQGSESPLARASH